MSDRSASMACPIDGAVLTMSERQGIEIDYCPQCRGVWLDRGELDKIIGRSADDRSETQAPRDQGFVPQAGYGGAPNYNQSNYGHGGRRKKSFLQELFD